MQVHADACRAIGHTDLATALSGLTGDAANNLQMCLQHVCAALANAFFPGCAVLVDMPSHMQRFPVKFTIACNLSEDSLLLLQDAAA